MEGTGVGGTTWSTIFATSCDYDFKMKFIHTRVCKHIHGPHNNMHLKYIIMLNERRQTQKTAFWMISIIGHSGKDKI